MCILPLGGVASRRIHVQSACSTAVRLIFQIFQQNKFYPLSFAIKIELQGITLRCSLKNLKKKNLLCRENWTYIIFLWDMTSILKRYTLSSWSMMWYAVIRRICRTVPSMTHPGGVMMYILRYKFRLTFRFFF